MQRSAALFLISVLVLSYYSKQFSYLQCKLINKFNTADQHCDCEKQSFAEISFNKELPVAKAQIHQDINDFYTATNTLISPGLILLLLTGSPARCKSASCKGNYDKLYRPPRYYSSHLITTYILIY